MTTQSLVQCRQSETDLGDRVQELTLDRDLIEFLVIVGWVPLEPRYERLRASIKENYYSRRAILPRSIKSMESRYVYRLEVYYNSGDLRTLQDLKMIVEEEGLRRFRDMGYKGLAWFNETLRQYGIEPFKVGGGVTPSYLKKYGLESSHY